MFKILLINPPRDNLVSFHVPMSINIDLGEISSFPPIGLMYLAEALRRRNPAFQVRIIDAVLDKMNSADVGREAAAFKPDAVGITAYTYTFYDVVETATEIKKVLGAVPVIVGGPQMCIFAAQTMTHDCFDYGIAGDGEELLSDLCESLYLKANVVPAQGLYYRRGGGVEGSGIAYLKDLNAMPIPAIDQIEPVRYFNTIGKKKAVGTLCTSRGCPCKCTFCMSAHRPYAARAVTNVVEEIERYIKYDVTDFLFFDDLFNITKKYVKEFCDEILRKNIKIGWMFRGRVDQIDDEVLSMAKKAGCHTILFGVEDATDEGLKMIRKNITIKQVLGAIKLCRKHRILSSTNWIIGFPRHRTMEDLKEVLRTAIRTGSDYAQFSVLQCLPGTELYDDAVRDKANFKDDWEKYVLKPTRDFSPPIWENHFSGEELFKFREHAYRSYYLRPAFILQEALRIRGLSEWKNKADVFRHIFLKKLSAIDPRKIRPSSDQKGD